ncbi:MAG TPA: ester cyclase [Vicinamibacterales bacterium]|nr:ester cyclase [Vicinamibacterales bacterium]
MSNLEENKAIVRRFVEAANARNDEALEAVTAPDIVRHCPATPDVVVRSREDFRRFLTRDAESFPDNRVQLDTIIAEGDLVAFWATYTGTQKGALGPFAASGKRASAEFSGVFRIEAGRITNVRLVWDNFTLLQQLGHLPVVP